MRGSESATGGHTGKHQAAHESQCQCGNLMRASDTCQRSWWREFQRICVNMRLLFIKIGLWQLLGELASDTHGHKLYYVADASIIL
jgi:hypothetical protein